jgi:hypothetical protein
MALVLTGCSPSPDPPTDGPSLPNSAARLQAPPIAGAPPDVAGRGALPPCGQEVITQYSGFDTQGRLCFWAAYLGGRPAEFISTRPTIEGDPATSVYRISGPGHVEVFIDSTRDKFGSRTWTRLICRTLSPIDGNAATPDFGPDDSCVAVLIP